MSKLSNAKISYIVKAQFQSIMDAIQADASIHIFEEPSPVESDVNYFNWVLNKVDNLSKAADPTYDKSKTYTQWIINQYCKKTFAYEDCSKISELLSKFDAIKYKLDSADINAYTYKSLNKIIDDTFKAVDLMDGIVTSTSDYNILHDGVFGVLATPITHKGSQLLGSGTKWCTASTSSYAFDRYSSISPLYIWRDKSGDKYQFWFGSTVQIMDAQDIAISAVKLQELRELRPAIEALVGKFEIELITSDIESVVAKADIISRLGSYCTNYKSTVWDAAEEVLFHPANHSPAADTGSGVLKAQLDYLQGTPTSNKALVLESQLLTSGNLYNLIEYHTKCRRARMGNRWVELESMIHEPMYIHTYSKVAFGEDRWIEREAELLTIATFDMSAVLGYYKRCFKDGTRWELLENFVARTSAFKLALYYYKMLNADSKASWSDGWKIVTGWFTLPQSSDQELPSIFECTELLTLSGGIFNITHPILEIMMATDARLACLLGALHSSISSRAIREDFELIMYPCRLFSTGLSFTGAASRACILRHWSEEMFNHLNQHVEQKLINHRSIDSTFYQLMNHMTVFQLKSLPLIRSMEKYLVSGTFTEIPLMAHCRYAEAVLPEGWPALEDAILRTQNTYVADYLVKHYPLSEDTILLAKGIIQKRTIPPAMFTKIKAVVSTQSNISNLLSDDRIIVSQIYQPMHGAKKPDHSIKFDDNSYSLDRRIFP